MLAPSDWHERFLQQARWTASVRRFLFQETNLAAAHRVLEAGCGTGAVLGEMPSVVESIGIDINFSSLEFAQQQRIPAKFICANVYTLPFAPASFDLAYCHFLLLWVNEPLAAIKELVRVCRPGAWILALAEPDYTARIDFPDELRQPGQLQAESLSRQGADPGLGRRLRSLFSKAGLAEVAGGLLGGEWGASPTRAEFELEWKIITSDLLGSVPVEQLAKWKKIDWEAWQNHARILFVPTFYALGKVNGSSGL